jgi:hypothetical protein
MHIALAALASLLATAQIPANAPDHWLQTRMDRVSAAAGIGPGAVHVVLVDVGSIALSGRGPTVAVPRALVANAPSAAAVDGILAMLLSYRQFEAPRRHGASIGEVAALAAVVAATGGASEGKNSKVIPTGAEDRPGTGEFDGRAMARRGVRWAEAAGGCTAVLTAYLRELASEQAEGSSTLAARRLLVDMGSLAYPSAQRCPISDDQGFIAVRAQLAPVKG